MIEETFLKLQHSESIICSMASQVLSAFILSGQVTAENEDVFIERSLMMAIKLAKNADRAIDSDGESIEAG